MSDFVLHRGRRAADTFARHYGAATTSLIFDPAQPVRITLADGREGRGTCLGCGQAPCMEKDSTELALAGELEAYPGDPSLKVCPTGAIVWDGTNAVAAINSEACIGCGLCIVRCPYGAISLDGGTVAAVATSDDDSLILAYSTKGEHAKPSKAGLVGLPVSPPVANLPSVIASLDDNKKALLVRNLFHELGINARVRRRGDTNMRIDAVGLSRSARPFVAEIELSAAVLESPRALLEDVAILHARYGYSVALIDPISVILSFPNIRSEYYQVIRDIENVLGIRCKTITIGGLIMLLWGFSRLDSFESDGFSPGAGRADLTKVLTDAGHSAYEPYPGALKPAK